MATAQRKSRRPARRKTAARKGKGDASLDRLNNSLDAAQTAIADLRKELGRGGRDLLKDVQKMVGDARRDTRRLNKRLRADLEELGGAITGRAKTTKKRAPARRAKSRTNAKSRARKSTAKKG
jgi:ABC-type transporter Mla subunit MlaD